MKEKIIMKTELITNDKIVIETDHTAFCKITRINYPDLSLLEKEVRTLRKELKNRKVSLYRTDTLKTLKERKHEYNELVNDYNNTFDQLVNEWNKKIEIGMFVGYGDDKEWNEVLKPLEWKLEKMNYNNTLLSKILDIQRKVNEVKNELKYMNEYTRYIKVAI